MGNFILNKTKIFDEQGSPWMNAGNEDLVNVKNGV